MIQFPIGHHSDTRLSRELLLNVSDDLFHPIRDCTVAVMWLEGSREWIAEVTAVSPVKRVFEGPKSDSSTARISIDAGFSLATRDPGSMSSEPSSIIDDKAEVSRGNVADECPVRFRSRSARTLTASARASTCTGTDISAEGVWSSLPRLRKGCYGAIETTLNAVLF